MKGWKENSRKEKVFGIAIAIVVFIAIVLIMLASLKIKSFNAIFKQQDKVKAAEVSSEVTCNYEGRYGIIADDERQKVVVAYVLDKSKSEMYNCDMITVDDDAMGWYYIDYHQLFSKEISEINPGDAIIIHYDDNFVEEPESWPRFYYRNIAKIEKIKN